MKSRMDRYYTSTQRTSRLAKNKNLYENDYRGDYNLRNYTNVEGVATMDNENEVDLRKLQNLLKKREEERRNEIPHLVKSNIEEKYEKKYEDDKNYDIKEVLKEAKTEKREDHKTRNLSDTSYNVLKSINIKEVEEEDKELQALINTLTRSAALNKMKDSDLSLDLLGELKSTNDTKLMSPSDIREEVKKQKDSYKATSEFDKIDKDFYTSSLGFSNDDFETIKDIQDSIKTNNSLIKVLVIILILAVIGGLIFLIFGLQG